MKGREISWQPNWGYLLMLHGMSVVVLVFGFWTIFSSMPYAELREGVVLKDWAHVLLPTPVDLSTAIFIVTYAATILILIHLVKRGIYFTSMAFIAYGFILVLRSFFIINVPLDPPEGIIVLRDPLISFFTTEEYHYTKDLFFSGHTASVFFFAYITRENWLRKLLFSMGLFVIVAISVQRVHYSIDIAGGVVVAYFASHLVELLYRKCWLIGYRPVWQKAPITRISTPN